MMELHYAGATAIISDEMAAALVEYAKTLGVAGSADALEVPSISEDGARGVLSMLVGPASQLVAEQTAHGDTDINDGAAIAIIQQKMRDLHPKVVMPSEPVEGEETLEDFDL